MRLCCRLLEQLALMEEQDRQAQQKAKARDGMSRINLRNKTHNFQMALTNATNRPEGEKVGMMLMQGCCQSCEQPSCRSAVVHVLLLMPVMSGTSWPLDLHDACCYHCTGDAGHTLLLASSTGGFILADRPQLSVQLRAAFCLPAQHSLVC